MSSASKSAQRLPKWLAAIVLSTGVMHGALQTIVKHNEGYSEVVYWDSAGVPTVCYGETKGVVPGERRTRSECDAQLQESLAEHALGLVQLPPSTPPVALLGALDAAYNIGVYGFKNSTSAKRLAAGDYAGAGDALLRFKYITVNGKKFDCSVKGNTKCYGLWKRRQWQADCIRGKFKTVREAVAALPK